MAVDRGTQVVAAFLTLCMFTMLGNMIKRDHFDSVEILGQSVILDARKIAEESGRPLIGPWKGEGQEPKNCWTKTDLKETNQSKGYITFSLTKGPEYHASQIVNAVLITKYLGATLVLPDISGNRFGETRRFQDIYDVERFVNSLDGIIKIEQKWPHGIPVTKQVVVKVPNGVKEEHIAEQIEPLLRKKGNLKLVTYFPSVNMEMKGGEQKGKLNSLACLAMFNSLKLRSDIQEIVESMVTRLKALSRKSIGQFVAVDLKTDMLQSKNCRENESSDDKKLCYNAEEIGIFLRKIGFDRGTTIYVTQSHRHDSLKPLRDIFPQTYTKESIIPADKKAAILGRGNPEFDDVLDFYLCSQSDVFVPTIPDLFYSSVAGRRIISGRTKILVPAQVPSQSSSSSSEYISPYVTEKNHLAYSCLH